MASFMSRLLQKIVEKQGRKAVFADPETFRQNCEAWKAEHMLPYKLNYKKFHVDIEERVIDGMPFYILNQKGKTSKNKALYLHGGAYVMEISPEHWKLIDQMAKDTGLEIWVPIYPLAPNHTVDEAYRVMAMLYEEFVKSSEDGHRILMGDSAGGGFAVGMAQYAKKHKLPLPDRMVLISPWMDLTMTNPAIEKKGFRDVTLDPYGLRICAEMWAGDRELRDEMVSPLFGDLALGCKTLIISGSSDILNGDAHELYDMLKSQGEKAALYEKEDLQHVFVMWPIPEAKKALKIIYRFIR